MNFVRENCINVVRFVSLQRNDEMNNISITITCVKSGSGTNKINGKRMQTGSGTNKINGKRMQNRA